MINFIKMLRAENSSNYKLNVLRAYENDEISELLKLTYDRVKYNFGISMKNIKISRSGERKFDFSDVYNMFGISGKLLLNYTQSLFDEYDPDSQEILRCILDRDLHAGINVKSINKIFRNITEMPYMRCSLIDKIDRVEFPAILQEKMDGSYRTFVVKNGNVESFSRSGEEYEYPLIFEEFKSLPNGAYIGELLVNLDESDAQSTRFKSNGLLNSDNVPEDLTFFAWDFLTLEEFANGYSDLSYNVRLEILRQRQNKYLKVVRSEIVNSVDQCMNFVKEWISQGKEGGVLKDFELKFENKTSPKQIKLKNEFDVDVECIGFTEGTGKRKDTFGALIFRSSDGLLEGQCSGFSDYDLNEISSNRDEYLGKILTVKATDISKAKNKEKFALTFPRFVCFRDDKTEADSFERIQEILNGSKTVKK